MSTRKSLTKKPVAKPNKHVTKLIDAFDDAAGVRYYMNDRGYGNDLPNAQKQYDIDRDALDAYVAGLQKQITRLKASDSKLVQEIKKFVKSNQISCGEAIYQTDSVSANGLDLIEKLCDIVGYHEFD